MADIRVKITTRNFSYGEKMYGKDGEYTVDEKTARYFVNNKKAIVIEGTLPDEADPLAKDISNATFLAMVRRNAKEIVTIIEEEMRLERDRQLLAEEAAEKAAAGEPALDPSKIEMTADMTVAPTDEPKVADDNSEGAVTDAETASSGPSESADTQNASVDDTDLPEDFPGRETLIKAGVTKVEQIPTDKEGLMALDGMTARLANQIGVKLAQE